MNIYEKTFALLTLCFLEWFSAIFYFFWFINCLPIIFFKQFKIVLREWTLWKESQVKKLREGKNSSSYTNISQWGESSFLIFLFWKKNQWIWKNRYVTLHTKAKWKNFLQSQVADYFVCWMLWGMAWCYFHICILWKLEKPQKLIIFKGCKQRKFALKA